MFVLTILGWPPSKSNRYRIVGGARSRGQQPAHLTTTEAVKQYEALVLTAVSQAIYTQRLPAVLWHIPPGRKKPKPINPIFPAGVEVDVAVELIEPLRTNRDIDGTLKLTFDALQHAGVYVNDVQVGGLRLEMPSVVSLDTPEQIRVTLTPRPIPSWSRNPGHRPVSTAVAARYLAQLRQQRGQSGA